MSGQRLLKLVWRIYANRKYGNLLQSIPHPKGYPLVGNILEFTLLPRNKRMETIVRYFNRYGPAFILYVESVVVIHTSSVEWAQFLLTSKTEIKKGLLYKFLKPWLFTGLITSDGEKWHQRRKMLTPAFHYSILNYVSDVVGRNSEVLMKNLEVEVNSDGFDVVPYISSCTLDIIGEAAMSVRLDNQRGSSRKYFNSIHSITQKIADRISNGLLYPDIIHRFSKNYRDQKISLNMLHGTSLKVIEQRIADRQNKKSDTLQNEKKKAFIDLLLDISDEAPESFSTNDLLEEVTTFMFAGHDTIGISIAWTLFLVGHHPEVQMIFGNSERLPDQSDLVKMKYLDCVFKESLRLYPPVSFISRCLTKDAKIGDCVVPAGVDICIHIHHLHRSPEHFKNPNKFDPSHFYAEEAQNRHPYAYIPFSAGPRNCLGQKAAFVHFIGRFLEPTRINYFWSCVCFPRQRSQKFAMLEQKIILSQIFRNFQVESLGKIEDVKCLPDIVLRPEFGVRIKIKKRKSSS